MRGGICKSVIRINQLLLAHLFFFIMVSVCLNGYEFFFFFVGLLLVLIGTVYWHFVVIRMISCYSTGTFFCLLSLSQLASCCGLLTRLDFRLKLTLFD